jgi:hypothetical protein
MEVMAANEKFDLKVPTKLLVILRCIIMWSQFGNFAQNTSLQNLDYETLSRFKNYNVSIGNSKSTIHLYLRCDLFIIKEF